LREHFLSKTLPPHRDRIHSSIQEHNHEMQPVDSSALARHKENTAERNPASGAKDLEAQSAEPLPQVKQKFELSAV
jgi:hypothetical protein